mmetsp:Transcript_92619/g.224831  ORF Transcript_92619/g.224831 Transcript_92619/m.224831 type:complete len:241 (-) Transcript_92619:756-1478(-)
MLCEVPETVPLHAYDLASLDMAREATRDLDTVLALIARPHLCIAQDVSAASERIDEGLLRRGGQDPWPCDPAPSHQGDTWDVKPADGQAKREDNTPTKATLTMDHDSVTAFSLHETVACPEHASNVGGMWDGPAVVGNTNVGLVDAVRLQSMVAVTAGHPGLIVIVCSHHQPDSGIHQEAGKVPPVLSFLAMMCRVLLIDFADGVSRQPASHTCILLALITCMLLALTAARVHGRAGSTR